MRFIILITALSLSACEREQQKDGSVLAPSEGAGQILQELPAELEALIDGVIDAMPEERRAEIVGAESAEMMVDHFGVGMALRNGELNQRGSEVIKYLTRQGIYHRDDFSSIILLSVNRRLRGEPIKLNEQIQEYRDYWEALDTIAPLDLSCPICGEEMEVYYLGEGVSKSNPERVYFKGVCSEHYQYLYYHADGWRPEDEVWGNEN